MKKALALLVCFFLVLSRAEYTQFEPDQNLITKLLHDCQPDTLDDCDMCTLCQNGAFCRTTIQNAQPLFTQAHNSLVSRNVPSNTQEALAHLKSLKDLTCFCVPGFTGNYCHLNINECLTVRCQNNATCVDGVNSFKCECPPGFTGKLIIHANFFCGVICIIKCFLFVFDKVNIVRRI